MNLENLGNQRITKLLAPYGIDPAPELAEMIRTYVSLLLGWNSKIALTTVRDPDEIVQRHFGESFFASSALGTGKGQLADIGTGAGFPGIPIRMVSAGLTVVLVESNSKKAAFLHEVMRRLGLSDIEIVKSRMEEVKRSDFDFITARALGDYVKLLQWARDSLKPSGKLGLLVGGEETVRLSTVKGWNWDQPHKIPTSKGRFVLVGNPA